MEFNETTDKIKKAVNTFSMLNDGDSVLIGFSGGKDSVVLLHSLFSLSKEYNINLTVLHVNHNIRGDESDNDEFFCRNFCKKYGIDFVCVSVDAIGYANTHKLGLEESARILRYNAFTEVAKQKGIKKIATAHTASDNLETVLFNLARGCAAEGLKGIPPVRDNIIRPLIYCTTDDILKYASEFSLNFVTDSTNTNTDYARNHIRHNIIPQIKKLNPSAENSVSNMCDILRTDLSFISECANNIYTDNTATLAHTHLALLSRILLDMYKKNSNGSQLSHIHISEMTSLIQQYVKNNCCDIKKLSLPEKIDFVVTPERVYFKKSCPKTTLKKHKLHMGLNEFEETGEALLITHDINDVFNVISKNIYKISIHTIVKKSILTDTIVRGRQHGDVFVFSNMTKKVKKMLNEAKIPIAQRDTLPFICDNSGIIWIAGFSPRDDALPTLDEESVHIFYLTQEKHYDK